MEICKLGSFGTAYSQNLQMQVVWKFVKKNSHNKN